MVPLELGVWRIDGGLKPVNFGPLDIESRLEDVLDEDIAVASPNWLVIGRQVRTDQGFFVDLLAIDRDANLVVLELKRDKACREIVAQLLDYGSWVRVLKDDRIAQIFDEYQKRWHQDRAQISIDEAFKNKFGVTMPDEKTTALSEIGFSHRLYVPGYELSSLRDSEPAQRAIEYVAPGVSPGVSNATESIPPCRRLRRLRGV